MAWALVWAARRSCSAKLSSLGRGCRRGRLPRRAGLLGLLAFVSQRGFVGDGLVGPVFQERHQGPDGLQGVKDIAATRSFRHGQGLPGSQTAACVSNCRLGMEASLLEFQEAERPRVAVTLILPAQQVAESGIDVGPHQHRPPTLENLVMGADSYAGQVLLTVVGAGLFNRALQDVVNLADGDGIIEQVTKELTDSADGTVTDQGQPQDCLI